MNSTLRAEMGWTQAVLSLEKYGIGTVGSQVTKLTLRVFNRKSGFGMQKFSFDVLSGG